MALFAKGKVFAATGVAVLCLVTGSRRPPLRQYRRRFRAWKADFAAEARSAGVGRAWPLAGAKYSTDDQSRPRLHKAFSGSVDAFMKRRGGSRSFPRAVR